MIKAFNYVVDDTGSNPCLKDRRVVTTGYIVNCIFSLSISMPFYLEV